MEFEHKREHKEKVQKACEIEIQREREARKRAIKLKEHEREAHEIEMQHEYGGRDGTATEAMIAPERELQPLTLQNDLDQKNMSCKWKG